jgi:hypothetical protein
MSDAPAAGSPAPSLPSRVIGIIFSPRATFERLLPAPKVVGVLLLAGLAIGLARGLPQLTTSGRQAAIDAQVQRMERFSGRSVTDEEYARMERFAPFSAYAALVGTPVFLTLGLLVLSVIYFVAFNVVLGGTATFKQVLAVAAHAAVISALGAIIAAPVQYLQGTANAMGPFTLAAALPMLDEGSFIARFLGFVEVFSIWSTIVTAIGFSVLYRRKTTNIAIGLFALVALFAAVVATVIGVFSSR